MGARLDIFLALLFTVAMTTPSMSQQPADPVAGCATDCESCTPDPFYEDNPIDLEAWEGCDVCCIDAQVDLAVPGDTMCDVGSGNNRTCLNGSGVNVGGKCANDAACDNDPPCNAGEADCAGMCVIGGPCANDAACDDDPPCNAGEADCEGKCLGSYLVAGRQALIDKGVCTAANITLVNKVSDCTAKICDEFTGTKLNVCILGHGAPGSIGMGAGKGASNGAAGGARDVLDAVSKPFFVGAVAGKIEEVHMFGCSVGQDWDFLQWLAQGLDAHVKAPDKVICSGGNLANNLNCFWFEMGGDFHDAWPLPHFTLTINFEVDVFGDSGPVDTVGLGIGEGPFVYEPVPPGVELDGMITEDLPDGFALDPNTGAISGTPTIDEIRHVACILKDPETGEPWDILWWEIIVLEGPAECGDGVCQPAEDCENCAPDCGPCPVCGNEICEEGEDCDVCPEDCPCEEGEVCVDGECVNIIPTVSEWGLIIMTLLALTAGTIVFGRRRRPAVA